MFRPPKQCGINHEKKGPIWAGETERGILRFGLPKFPKGPFRSQQWSPKGPIRVFLDAQRIRAGRPPCSGAASNIAGYRRAASPTNARRRPYPQRRVKLGYSRFTRKSGQNDTIGRTKEAIRRGLQGWTTRNSRRRQQNVFKENSEIGLALTLRRSATPSSSSSAVAADQALPLSTVQFVDREQKWESQPWSQNSPSSWNKNDWTWWSFWEK